MGYAFNLKVSGHGFGSMVFTGPAFAYLRWIPLCPVRLSMPLMAGLWHSAPNLHLSVGFEVCFQFLLLIKTFFIDVFYTVNLSDRFRSALLESNYQHLYTLGTFACCPV